MLLLDGDLQHLSTPSSPVERPKKTATRRRHDDNARSESDVGKSITTTRNVLSLVQYCFTVQVSSFLDAIHGDISVFTLLKHNFS